MIREQKDQSKVDTLRMAILWGFLLTLAVSVFGQSAGGAGGNGNPGADKLEPGFRSRAQQAQSAGRQVPAIVQFEEDCTEAERLTMPSILAQGNGYLNAEGAVRLARAIAQNSSSMASGTQWIADPGAIRSYSVIAGEAILWGDTLLWDCSVGTASILQRVSGAWATAFLDPTSIAISNESILINGELGTVTGILLAGSDSAHLPSAK